jgi:hypothetical protein
MIFLFGAVMGVGKKRKKGIVLYVIMFGYGV